jgi:ribonuclease HI
MPEHREPQDRRDNNARIRLLQINLNKSEKAHLDIINEQLCQDYDIILIQEPHTTIFNAIRTPTNFRPVFPIHRFVSQDQIRSVIWVSRKLDTNNWAALDIPGTNDVTGIQLKSPFGTISIFNIYNDCTHSRNEAKLRQYIQDNPNIILATDNHHMLWAGDFNRHHPLWDRDEDVHLFSQQANRFAEGLIDLIATYELVMALPKGVPTLKHMASGRYSRPDNVFSTTGISDLITRCEVVPSLRPTSTDHFPIVTNIQLPQERVDHPPSFNFREVDWDEFRKKLDDRLSTAPRLRRIVDQQQLTTAVETLTLAIQETIQEKVAVSKPRPDAKRWWNGDLRKARKELYRIRANSFRNRAIADHPSHEELRVKSSQYGELIVQAKRQHWTDYLEEMTAADMWTANKFIREPVGDGGSPRIPTLKVVNQAGEETLISDNEEKARTFARMFFPPPPPRVEGYERFEYPEPLADPPRISASQIRRHIAKLSPYKAPGPDGIPNIVLQKCVNNLMSRLIHIYRAILDLDVYYEPWKEFTTVVLRKPGKPSYEVPKAHRPIALISTMAKVLTAIVAENLSKVVEKHQLLPKTHFGGRPGRSTADAVHYLVDKVCTAWRTNKVVSVLFLDVEGAFPNAVTARLTHNLKRRRVPAAIVRYVGQLLKGRKTRLKFDDYVSEVTNITNGIGQGDPISMLLYILYNADLLDLPDNPIAEDAIGYVDDIALVATGSSFRETTRRLKEMMTKDDGGLRWSVSHNSRFEVTKSAVIHFSRKTVPDPEIENGRIQLGRPTLTLEGQVVQEVDSYKYLGVQIDSQLRWREQAQRATANATKWILQFRRLTRPSTGVRSKLMRQLYLAVALPKITYGIDIWYTPPNKPAGQTRNSGSVGILRSLGKVQRIAALAITGVLRSSPNDYVDVHAGILPMELALLKACHSALVRSLTLPSTNPIHQVVQAAKHRQPSKFPGPMDNLLKLFALKDVKIETIFPSVTLNGLSPRRTVLIDKSREVSIQSERADEADFKLYSDGSGQDDGIGASAVLYEKRRARPLSMLQAFMGAPDHHNTFEAEAVGAVLALWILGNTPATIGKTVSLFTDNQSIVTSLPYPKATPGQYLLSSLRSAIEGIGCKLTVKWISGHSKVKGNEMADRLAKQAAAGLSSARDSLPHLLRSPLPKSASALKQSFMKELKAKWAESWEASPRKLRVSQFGGVFPFSSLLNRLNSLSRQQASLILQLRCGHFPLNSYLHRIKKVESDRCGACRGGREGPAPETVNHFIFDCPAYVEERRELIRKIGRDHFHLPDIMSEVTRMKALTTFINRTGRLRL